MSAEKLLKTLPVLHEQLDALLEFEATPQVKEAAEEKKSGKPLFWKFVCLRFARQDLNNGVINAAFVLLFKDLIRLFACYNDGIINLLGIVTG